MDVADPRVARTRQAALDAGRHLLTTGGIDAITHAQVARLSRLGRRTLYRHWPNVTTLVHDVLAHGEIAHAPITGVLRVDLVAHLDTLARALRLGQLGYVVCALGERARVEPSFEPLRRELTDEGCAVVRAVLEQAATTGALPADVDVAASLATLEGPVFYRLMIRREDMAPHDIDELVVRFLADPPRRRTRRRSIRPGRASNGRGQLTRDPPP